MLVDDGSEDAGIPGENYGFRQLIDAQSTGDLQTLREHDLRAVRLRVPAADPASAVDALARTL